MSKASEILKNKKTGKKGKKAKKEMTFKESVVSWTKTILGAIIVVMLINGFALASFVVPTGSMENTVMTGDFVFVNKFVYGPSTPQVIPFVDVPLPYYKFPGIQEPEKGDVIVFIWPGARDDVEADAFQYYLKRCVATAGDTLKIVDKKLYVNGEEYKLPEEGKFAKGNTISTKTHNTFPKDAGFSVDNYGPIRIPKEGDVIQLNSGNIDQWKVFIEREGHEVSSISGVKIDGQTVDKYVVERDYVFGMGDNRDLSYDSRSWGFIPVENVVGSPIVVYWSWDTGKNLFKDFFDKLSSTRWSRIGTLID